MDEGVLLYSVLSVSPFAIGFIGVFSTIPATIRCSVNVDDLALYVNGAKLLCMVLQLQLAIDRVSSWYSVWFHILHWKQSPCSSWKKPCRGDRIQTLPILTFYGSPIYMVTRVWFLGLFLDERLPYIHHIKASCRRSLYLLRHLTSKTWVADRNIMFALAKLDYLPFMGRPSSRTSILWSNSERRS